jgi:N-glycosylase/DNA lyase
MDVPLLLHNAVVQLASDIDCRVRQRRDCPSLDERGLRWELACCVLSSQVSYRLAVAAADDLQEQGILEDISQSTEELQVRLKTILSLGAEVEGSVVRYRFAHSKAQQLARALAMFRDRHGSIRGFVESVCEAETARRWLIDDVPGLGPKQASMFLRNIGISYDLAVLDRHVLHYMDLQRLQPGVPANPSGLTGYETLENSLRKYASGVGFEVGIVDWSIWFVMRAAKSLGYFE